MSRNLVFLVVASAWLTFIAWVIYDSATQPDNPTESICTMDGDQARAFKRMCEAEGGEVRIHEYTCTKE